MSTSIVAGIIVILALGFLIAIRSGFRGVSVSVG